MDFTVIFIFALVGLCARPLIGFNFWAAIGTAGLAILIIPGLLNIGVQTDSEAVQTMVDAYIAKLTNAMPSIIIGEVAGFFAYEVYQCLRGVAAVFSR